MDTGNIVGNGAFRLTKWRFHDVIEVELPQYEASVVNARDKAQALDAELSGLRQRLSDKKNAISVAKNRIAFNDGRGGVHAGDVETLAAK